MGQTPTPISERDKARESLPEEGAWCFGGQMGIISRSKKTECQERVKRYYTEQYIVVDVCHCQRALEVCRLEGASREWMKLRANKGTL